MAGLYDQSKSGINRTRNENQAIMRRRAGDRLNMPKPGAAPPLMQQVGTGVRNLAGVTNAAVDHLKTNVPALLNTTGRAINKQVTQPFRQGLYGGNPPPMNDAVIPSMLDNIKKTEANRAKGAVQNQQVSEQYQTSQPHALATGGINTQSPYGMKDVSANTVRGGIDGNTQHNTLNFTDGNGGIGQVSASPDALQRMGNNRGTLNVLSTDDSKNMFNSDGNRLELAQNAVKQLKAQGANATDQSEAFRRIFGGEQQITPQEVLQQSLQAISAGGPNAEAALQALPALLRNQEATSKLQQESDKFNRTEARLGKESTQPNTEYKKVLDKDNNESYKPFTTVNGLAGDPYTGKPKRPPQELLDDFQQAAQMQKQEGEKSGFDIDTMKKHLESLQQEFLASYGFNPAEYGFDMDAFLQQ